MGWRCRVDADRQSFEEYVRARSPGLARIAYLLTGDHHLAEDLVQQALIRVAARWRRIVAAGDPDGYLRRVLYTQHVSWWRRARRAGELRAHPPDRVVPDHSGRIAVEVAVRRALARVAPRQRAVLVRTGRAAARAV